MLLLAYLPTYLPTYSPSITLLLLSTLPSLLLSLVIFNINLLRLLVIYLASGLANAGFILNYYISNYPIVFNTIAYLLIT